MRSGNRGFTLIELMVVLTVLAILAAIITPQYMERADDAREVVLRQDLVAMRTVIDQFYRDKARYPATLEELVKERYIRAIPVDPITERNDSWIQIAPTEGSALGVFDIRSGAKGKARDGTEYASW